LRGLELAIWRSLAFGKNHGSLPCAKNADQRFERSAVATRFGVDRNHVQLRQDPAHEPTVQKRLAREKKNRAIRNTSHERRIEEALVIRSQNHWPVIDHPLAMDDAEPKKNPGQQLGEIVANRVVRIQSGLGDFHPLHFQTADDFTDDAFNRQVGAVDDMRVLRDNERRGAA